MPTIVRYSDELYHHGIKGQKWGVRRYQNEDGSLTPEGQKRYGVNTTTFTLNKDNWDSKEGVQWRNRVRKSSGIAANANERYFKNQVLKKGRSIDLDLDAKSMRKENKKDMNILARSKFGVETGAIGLGKKKTAYKIRGKDAQDAERLRVVGTALAAALLAANAVSVAGALAYSGASLAGAKDIVDNANANFKAKREERKRQKTENMEANGLSSSSQSYRKGSIGDPNRYTRSGKVKPKYRNKRGE